MRHAGKSRGIDTNTQPLYASQHTGERKLNLLVDVDEFLLLDSLAQLGREAANMIGALARATTNRRVVLTKVHVVEIVISGRRLEQIRIKLRGMLKVRGLAGEKLNLRPSVEYGVRIMNAMVTNEPALIYGNVRNTRLIDNLPENCCVEVPVVVDRNGLRPCHVGKLPPELAAHCAPHVFVQELTVRAALDHAPRCSSIPGWHPISGPALLCDCGAIVREWERRRAATAPTSGEQADQ